MGYQMETGIPSRMDLFKLVHWRNPFPACPPRTDRHTENITFQQTKCVGGDNAIKLQTNTKTVSTNNINTPFISEETNTKTVSANKINPSFTIKLLTACLKCKAWCGNPLPFNKHNTQCYKSVHVVSGGAVHVYKGSFTVTERKCESPVAKLTDRCLGY